jgi:hypothetical protein
MKILFIIRLDSALENDFTFSLPAPVKDVIHSNNKAMLNIE